jgi:hypothetical protein
MLEKMACCDSWKDRQSNIPARIENTRYALHWGMAGHWGFISHQDDLRRFTKRPTLRQLFDFSASIFGTDT